MPVAVGAWRRKPKRMFAKFGGDDRGTARARQGRSVLEVSGDLRIRALRREREVTGPVERVARDRCETSVRATPLARRSTLVKHRREERVRKANRPGSVFDYLSVERRLEHSVRDAQHPREAPQRDGRAPMRVARLHESGAEGRRVARERDPRVSLGPRAAASGRRPRPERARARAHRTDCRPRRSCTRKSDGRENVRPRCARRRM